MPFPRGDPTFNIYIQSERWSAYIQYERAGELNGDSFLKASGDPGQQFGRYYREIQYRNRVSRMPKSDSGQQFAPYYKEIRYKIGLSRIPEQKLYILYLHISPLLLSIFHFILFYPGHPGQEI